MSLNLGRLSVLVVEDVREMRTLMMDVLEKLGIGKMYQASDGTSGFESFMQFNPDVVMLDWEMPEMDGIEMTRRIRKSDFSPNKMAPIIMITGYSALSRVGEARDAGVTEFLVKPFSAKAVSKRLEHIVNNPRDFIVLDNYTGPDRRRCQAQSYKGPWRREDDQET